jgi:hypothetical protein
MTKGNQDNLEKLSRIQVLVFMAVTALILLAIAQIWQRVGSINIIPLEFTSSAFLQGIILAILIIIASAIITKVWPQYRISAEKYLDFVISPLAMPDLIWVGLLPGLSEELLFRGVMIPALGYDWFALIISSVLFGVLHLNDRESWYYVTWAVIIGFVLGYSVYLTGNLLVPVVAHILINLFSSLYWKLKNRTL